MNACVLFFLHEFPPSEDITANSRGQEGAVAGSRLLGGLAGRFASLARADRLGPMGPICSLSLCGLLFKQGI